MITICVVSIVGASFTDSVLQPQSLAQSHGSFPQQPHEDSSSSSDSTDSPANLRSLSASSFNLGITFSQPIASISSSGAPTSSSAVSGSKYVVSSGNMCVNLPLVTSAELSPDSKSPVSVLIPTNVSDASLTIFDSCIPLRFFIAA